MCSLRTIRVFFLKFYIVFNICSKILVLCVPWSHTHTHTYTHIAGGREWAGHTVYIKLRIINEKIRSFHMEAIINPQSISHICWHDVSSTQDFKSRDHSVEVSLAYIVNSKRTWFTETLPPLKRKDTLLVSKYGTLLRKLYDILFISI